jgi:hypothetical protein
VYIFDNAYTVPWNTNYYAGVVASLECNSTLANDKDEATECVNMEDLYMVRIDDPSSSVDRIGSSIQVTAALNNRHDLKTYTGANITVVVENAQMVQMEKFTEMTGNVRPLATASHTFTQFYTVPNDSVYYLTVYIDSYDNYPHNDTMKIKRYTETVGIHSIDGTDAFTLGQNIPNPANENTLINYSIPEAGEVIFHVHSISGQLLYSKTIEAQRGNQSIELNTSTLSAGIYFYSTEYKGQRIVKRMNVR